MIVPIIASTTRDLFQQVPPLPKEGASALGMTDWEVANRSRSHGCARDHRRHRARPRAGAGRDHRHRHDRRASLHIPPTIYLPFTTIAATILTQLDGALTDGTGFAVATLAELALVLAVISVVVNLVARLIIKRTGRVGAPVGGA